ncbi:MAG: ComF family protein [Clostridia bacterium]|nr:ComF family protein [Clostridia bacterium]
MKQKIKDFGNKILDLIYPKNIKCMFCMDELNQNSYNCTCENCLEILPFIKNPCERCGSQMNENQKGVCMKCKKRNYNFERAKSVFEYNATPKIVVHGLKYGGKKYLAEYMVKYLLDVYSTWNIVADIVTCVPTFSLKAKGRDYNHSQVLAEIFANELKLPFYDLVTKRVDTSSQTSLNTRERMENMKDSFAFKHEFKDLIKGKSILIIDDVITTGATTNEISKILKESGAKACFVLTFAHTKLEQLDFED